MARRRQYTKVISHSMLNERRIIKAGSLLELWQKENIQQQKWDNKWAEKREKMIEKENKDYRRALKQKNEEDCINYAQTLTEQADAQQQALDRILLDRKPPCRPDPDRFKDYSPFPEKAPESPSLSEIPQTPIRSDEKYNPKIPFFTKLSKKKMAEYMYKYNEEYERDYAIWKRNKDSIDAANNEAIKEYDKQKTEWVKRQVEYFDIQTKENNAIDEVISKYKTGDTDAVEQYFIMVMEGIEFPISYDMQAETEYDPENKRLIVDLFIPTVDDIPKLKSVSYIKSRKEYKETYYPDTYIKKKYDNVVYQIVILCLDYLFTIGGEDNLIDYIVLNGRVNTIDKATGRNIQPVVLSLAVDRESFNEVNIDAVDPKTWFKSVKGVSAVSIATVTPVAPIIRMSREDDRFVEGYNVVDGLDEGVNLAAIDWQDFENLIRELFEKEFKQNGGEVKITQASRDGGVDAIAFDPDPIRGGKIVIQAKRYTNVVNVSAVRDLYGTVVNEGATKGILVTTSDYGNDSYNFVQGKPLTLLNGENLLYLLEKHGYRMRINLKEAKETQRQY